MLHFTVVDSLVTLNLEGLNITEVCAGAPLNVSFSSTGSFLEDNLFEIQLSDASGSFENPVKIGESTNTGIIQCQIPLNIPQGNAYRVRIYATKPSQISNVSFDSFRVNARKVELLSPNDNIDTIAVRKVSEIIKASNSIQLNAHASYQSGRYILLNPGFEVNTGAIFETRIKGCF